MKQRLQMLALFVLVVTIIVSCSIFLPASEQQQEVEFEGVSMLGEAQVIDIVWNSLEPNTSSHKRSSWQVMEAYLVIGEKILQQFEGEPAPDCWFGPKPPENKEINPTKDYWYVLMTPYPATPEPFYGTSSPTAPPLIPEPFLKYAYFLVDPLNGEIIARSLICIIY